MSKIDYENDEPEINTESTHQAVLRFSDSLQRAQEVFEENGYSNVEPLKEMIADSSKIGWTAARLVDKATNEESTGEEIEEAQDYEYSLESASDTLEDLCDKLEDGYSLTQEDLEELSEIRTDLFCLEEDEDDE